ncbi:MAG: PHB depolymerase family esterase [Rhodanobacteraceae bacterium]
MRGHTFVGIVTMALIVVLATARFAVADTLDHVVFDQYPPYSRSSELVRRLLSPLNARRVRQTLARSGKALREQLIDLAQESFAIHIPPDAPANGYALLVFVPPWREARVPSDWIAALDRRHVAFVTASNSGNDADVMDRRIPLALLAAANAVHRWRIDPTHVYVGGFSGGARVALRIALAWPDVFNGVLLDAGSDAIGNAQIPLPPAELMLRFQQSTRVVYLTGALDDFHRTTDARSRDSLKEWCAFDLQVESMPRVGHELAGAASFGHALDLLLESHVETDPQALADCRARVDRQLDAQLVKARQRLAHGERGQARALVEQIDTRYGGLAAPRTIDLFTKVFGEKAHGP